MAVLDRFHCIAFSELHTWLYTDLLRMQSAVHDTSVCSNFTALEVDGVEGVVACSVHHNLL